MRLILSDVAVAEARRARLWYEVHSARAAERFMDALDDAVERILESPRRWRVRGGVRRCSLRSFPYRVVYRVDADVVVIVAVSHTSRRPGHWRDR